MQSFSPFRYWLSVFVVMAGCLTASPVFAERISSFDVTATLNQDRSVVVDERISYDFESLDRHGIYRDIPVVYQTKFGSMTVPLKIESVTMDGGEVDWKQSAHGSETEVKIGNAATYVTGKHVYEIRYSLSRVLLDLEGVEEFYWNVTGNGWSVPIDRASIAVHAPGTVTEKACYTGLMDTRGTNCAISIKESLASATTTKGLGAAEGLTVAFDYPKGTFRALTWWDYAQMLFDEFGILLVPVLVFVVMAWIWNRYGRNPAGRGTIVAQYEEPRGLSPIEMTSLLNESTDQKSVTATILDLARRGYITINYETKEGWISKSTSITLVKKCEADEKMQDFERPLFEALFKLGDELKPAMASTGVWKGIEQMRGQVFDRLKPYLPRNPATVRAFWLVIAVFVFFGGMIGIDSSNFLVTASLAVSGVIVGIFGYFMPQPTKEGAIVQEEIKGFKWFLGVTETERLKFHNAPAKTPQMFERFLPSAIALGVDKEWAEQFKDMPMSQPSYVHGNMGTWNALTFTHMTNQLNQTAASGMYHAPGSRGTSGGGSSGGGFGGGGGGSW